MKHEPQRARAPEPVVAASSTRDGAGAYGDDFARTLSGRVCVLGIGNRDRGDDAAGSLLAESLEGLTEAVVIDAGAVPENYLGKVLAAEPDTIVIVDAVDFASAPGTVAWIDPARVGPSALSTHALSLGMAVDYLSARSGAEVLILGIQPAGLEPGAAVSDEVTGGLVSLTRRLLACFAPAPQPGETDNEHR